MKARHRKHRETGGVNEAEQDLKTKPMRYTADSKVNDEAEERKRGGRAKKSDMMASGGKSCANAGRKPRKSGGSATSNPFSSARAGTPAKGRKVEMNMD